jgi:hypothetical protein
MSYFRWCRSEAKRLESGGLITDLVIEGGRCALFESFSKNYSKPIRYAKRVLRLCLWCGEHFPSDSKANRFCHYCGHGKNGIRPRNRRLGLMSCGWCGRPFINNPNLRGDCPDCQGHPRKRRKRRDEPLGGPERPLTNDELAQLAEDDET